MTEQAEDRKIPWWERFPGRLEAEEESLRQRGIDFERDESLASSGILRLRFTWPIQTTVHQFVATYPAEYPYFKFEVISPTLSLERHQHPAGGLLCLLPREAEGWRAGSDRIGDILEEQLPKILAANETIAPEALAELEVQQAEPITEFFSYPTKARILVPDDWSPSHGDRAGYLRCFLLRAGGPDQFLSVVIEILSEAKEQLWKSSLFALKKEETVNIFEVPWIGLDNPLDPKSTAEELLRLARSKFSVSPPRFTGNDQPRVRLCGFIFPEEHEWRGGSNQRGRGWLFAAKTTTNKRRRHYESQTYLIRASRVGPEFLGQRVPSLDGLRERKVAVFGLGSLGAPAALELARSGIGKLWMMDCDSVEPGNSVRWPRGFYVVGLPKVEIIGNQIYCDNFTNVEICGARLGAPPIADDVDPEALSRYRAFLAQSLDDVDLVFDATGDLGVQQFLSDQAREVGLPYVAVQGTPGAWGGMITRIVPGRTEGCWLCLQLNEDILGPPEDCEEGTLQPTGCADLSFTGTNFDLMPIVNQGVRIAISTLLSGKAGGYPDQDWDVAVLSLRDPKTGAAILPKWASFKLRQHPKCPHCKIQSEPS